ncbi:GntR family transcriptional regulator [bacterium]|nr:MAG: GntR family transcriptional regulator [bacterium]
MDSFVDYSDTSEHLYLQVANHLKKRIKNKDFGEDGRIPNYVHLSQDYNVSMSTIKKAMQLLNDENVISSRVGKGTFANPEFMLTDDKSKLKVEGQLGLLIRDIEGPYFSGVYRGLADEADKHNKKLLLTVSRDIHQQEESLLTLMMENKTEGLLITTRRKSLYGISIYNQIYEEKIPTVLIHDVYGSKFPIIDVDNYLGGRLVAEHLVKLKLKNFAVFVGENGSRGEDMRLRGFHEGLKDGGVDIKKQCLTYRLSFTTEAAAFEEGYKIGKSIAFKELGIQGVFLSNDLIAMGFQKGVLERGYKIPEDLAVIGFDNIDRVSEAWVPLTTIESPRQEIGESALNLLLDLINKKRFNDSKNTFLKPKLVIRDSA